MDTKSQDKIINFVYKYDKYPRKLPYISLESFDEVDHDMRPSLIAYKYFNNSYCIIIYPTSCEIRIKIKFKVFDDSISAKFVAFNDKLKKCVYIFNKDLPFEVDMLNYIIESEKDFEDILRDITKSAAPVIEQLYSARLVVNTCKSSMKIS